MGRISLLSLSTGGDIALPLTEETAGDSGRKRTTNTAEKLSEITQDRTALPPQELYVYMFPREKHTDVWMAEPRSALGTNQAGCLLSRLCLCTRTQKRHSTAGRGTQAAGTWFPFPSPSHTTHVQKNRRCHAHACAHTHTQVWGRQAPPFPIFLCSGCHASAPSGKLSQGEKGQRTQGGQHPHFTPVISFRTPVQRQGQGFLTVTLPSGSHR